MITNNLVVKAPRIEFFANFTITQSPDLILGNSPLNATNEAVAFTFSNEPYNIKNFDQNALTTDFRGLGLFFFRPNGTGTVFLKEVSEPGMFNLQSIYSENWKQNKRMYCKHEYLNSTTTLMVSLDFSRGVIEVFVNQKSCIKYRLSDKVFSSNKATFSMIGYSSVISPITLKYSELSAYKEATLMPSVDSFHSNIQNLVTSLHRYDPYHAHNASLSNVMIVEVSLLGKDQKRD